MSIVEYLTWLSDNTFDIPCINWVYQDYGLAFYASEYFDYE